MGTPAQFPITDIIQVSISSPPPGFQGLNTGNLTIFTDDSSANSFPASGIQYYNGTQQVGTDFGTSSRTFTEAKAIFGQNPNILLPGGQLIVVAMKTAQIKLAFSAVPANGQFKIDWQGSKTAFITHAETTANIQAAVQAIAPLAQVIVTGSLATQDLELKMWGVYGEDPSASLTITDNTLVDGGSAPITVVVSTPSNQKGESIVDTLNRVLSQVAMAAVITNEAYANIGTTDFEAAATAFQAQQIAFGVVGSDPTLVQTTGDFYKNTLAGNTQTRTLLYEETDNGAYTSALAFLAGYMSRLMSVDYTGNKTTLTMNLKQLNGVNVDDVIQPGTDVTNAKAAGSDLYVSIMGAPSVRSFGANLFADQVMNRLWLQGAVQVALFNTLRQTSTKILQTQDGMNALISSLKGVLEQAVANGMLAPGTWKSPDTFGNITDFFANIAQFGYYVFAAPIGEQSESDREARKAPLIQVAAKEAGAVHSSSILIEINP